MLTGNSRRRHFRKPVQVVVVVRKAYLKNGEVKDPSSERFIAQDISPGGIGLVGPVAFEEGTVLDLEFRLESEQKDFKIQVEVRSCKPFGRNPKPVAIGTQFIHLSPQEIAAIAKFSSVSFLA